jgi:hypothetical protein
MDAMLEGQDVDEWSYVLFLFTAPPAALAQFSQRRRQVARRALLATSRTLRQGLEPI